MASNTFVLNLLVLLNYNYNIQTETKLIPNRIRVF